MICLLQKGGRRLKDRIKKVRKDHKLTQAKFGERIGVKGNTVTGYETGLRNPTDAVILSICREFNINEEWLRTGKEPMKISTKGRLSAYVADIVHGDDDFIQDLIEVYMELDPDSKKALRITADKLVEKRKGRE